MKIEQIVKKLTNNKFLFIGIILLIGFSIGWITKPSDESSDHQHGSGSAFDQLTGNDLYTMNQPPHSSNTKGPTTGRRQFLATVGASAAGLLLGSRQTFAARPPKSFPMGKADHCIMLWLGGGACQIDTWDPKRRGDAKKKKAGSYYDEIPTAVDDIQVCEHLPRSAQIMDRLTLIRTVYHNTIDEHAAAVNRMHTGRPTSGTVIYPAIGSVISHQRGPANEGVPPYVLIGYPNLTRGPGFLGARHGYLYLAYPCSNCESHYKTFAVEVEREKGSADGTALKYGEDPPFGRG